MLSLLYWTGPGADVAVGDESDGLVLLLVVDVVDGIFGAAALP